QERFGSASAFAPRPAHFHATGELRSEGQDCAGRRPRFRSYWFGFRDRGRGFHALVAVGRSASRARARQAFALLDSLRLSRRRPVRISDDDALPFDDDARGLALVHPSAWDVHRGPLTQVAPLRNQLALATFEW